MLGLEGERAVLLGVLLVQAAQVGQLLDHLGVEEASAWVVDPDVGLQCLRQVILELLDAVVVLDTGTICHQRMERVRVPIVREVTEKASRSQEGVQGGEWKDKENVREKNKEEKWL